MVENESARGVGSVALKFRLTLEYRREGCGVEQPWFWPDGSSLSFQRRSRLRCRGIKARNHQGLSSPGFHAFYKTKVALVQSSTNPYPLTCFDHRYGVLHGQ